MLLAFKSGGLGRGRGRVGIPQLQDVSNGVIWNREAGGDRVIYL